MAPVQLGGPSLIPEVVGKGLLGEGVAGTNAAAYPKKFNKGSLFSLLYSTFEVPIAFFG